MNGRQILITADAYARLSDIAFREREETGVLPSFDEIVDDLLADREYQDRGV